MEILDQALEAVRTFKPTEKSQVAVLLAKTADVAKNGKYELFKTEVKFDSTAQNPKGLGNQYVPKIRLKTINS